MNVTLVFENIETCLLTEEVNKPVINISQREDGLFLSLGFKSPESVDVKFGDTNITSNLLERLNKYKDVCYVILETEDTKFKLAEFYVWNFSTEEFTNGYQVLSNVVDIYILEFRLDESINYLQ